MPATSCRSSPTRTAALTRRSSRSPVLLAHPQPRRRRSLLRSVGPFLSLILLVSLGGPGALAAPHPDGDGDRPEGAKTRRQIAEARAEQLREQTGGPIRYHAGELYDVFTDSTTLKLDSYTRNLERAARGIAETLEAKLGEEEPPFVVIHFESRKAYETYGRKLELEEFAVLASACFARRLPGKPVLVQGRSLGDLLHEAAHQIVERKLGPGLADWPWIAEGLAAVLQVVPPRNFTRTSRYAVGRERLLEKGFDLESFATSDERQKGMYEVGGTIHRALLFGERKAKWRLWLRRVAQTGELGDSLSTIVGLSWAELHEEVRAFCWRKPPLPPPKRPPRKPPGKPPEGPDHEDEEDGGERGAGDGSDGHAGD